MTKTESIRNSNIKLISNIKSLSDNSTNLPTDIIRDTNLHSFDYYAYIAS